VSARGVAAWVLSLGLAMAASLAVVLAAPVAHASADGGPPAAGTTGRPARNGPVRRDVTAFRVDVSRYPQIGAVVTVPGSGDPNRDDFLVLSSGTHAQVPGVRKLSPADIELMLAPDAAGGLARTRPQWAAAARFLAGLPAGARIGVADPARPAVVAVPLSVDPARAVLDMAAPAPVTTPVSTAARLAASLSAFTRGSRVRRTVVLALTADEALSRAEAARFAQQLAASGTALYILDAAPRSIRSYDALATASGGGAIRIRRAADWGAGLARIASQLSRQYYLRFTDRAPLPGRAVIAVRTDTGVVQGTAVLPVANPVAPSPVRVLVPTTPRSWDIPFVGLAALLIVIGVGYGLGMLAVSRREPRWPSRHRRRGLPPPPRVSTDRLFHVFLMPCLNEEKVLPNSLRRLLSIPGGNFVIMVIDDGSDDGTVEAISDLLGDRVWLLSRKAPNARQGKGEALNAAIRYLTGSGLLDGYAAEDVITVVVDADGRLDRDAIAEVTPYFADPTVGAVQIGVRINNRHQSRLARMQDIEFVVYTEVFQRGRRHLGSVGLGGNGQFVRLSALLSLGGSPWTRSLTDDLDLGVRLIACGWRNEYCPRVAVHQQGVVELRRLIRQRSRWFQGHLQSWKLIPLVLRRVPRRARTDLFYHLTSPAILLIASLLSASFVVSLADCVVLAAHGHNPVGWWIVSTYALTFGPALVYNIVYWTRERAEGLSLLRAVWFAHLYVCYGMMWYASGWWAVGRTLRGRTGWAKTDRVTEIPVATPARVEVAARRPQPVLAVGSPAPPTPPVPLLALASTMAATALTVPLPLLPESSRAESPGAEPPRRRRRWPSTVSTIAVCAALATALVWSGVLGGGPQPWLTAFNGYGTTAVSGSGTATTISLTPATTRTPQVTHAALVVSTDWYSDFAATVRLRTLRQLRNGPAGHPHQWEVAWLIWHYDSNQRFYALTLEANGWVLSKQDPAYPGGERFLASGPTPRFRVGAWHRVGVVQVGDQITVTADGRPLSQFTDTQRPYLNGAFGVYSEDAAAQFTGIRLRGLARS
jgi:cellulose synthase/poly-beta-1,6-N-acetylglucosamine synthase-like glycosyltransferase